MPGRSGRRRKVRWSDAAAGDLGSIVEYIARDRPLAAEGILAELKKRAGTLALAAERGRVVPELDRHGIRDYREILVSMWRIVYRITPEAVQVVFVIDSRRNVEDELLRRLTR